MRTFSSQIRTSARCCLPFVVLLTFVGQRAHAGEPLDALVAAYKIYGLPLPPKEAELAILPSPQVTTTNGVRHQDMFLILLLKKPTAQNKPVYWVGCDEGWTWRGIEFRPVKVNKGARDTTAPMPDYYNDNCFPTHPDLLLAIQCHTLGWRELATALLERSRRQVAYTPFKRPLPWPRDDRKTLAEVAWDYHCNQFVKSVGDRRTIVGAMKRILESAKEIDTTARRNIVSDMERTLVVVPQLPDSLEAALEGLLDFKDSWGSFLGSGWADVRNNAARDPSYRKLQNAGLHAVPLLLAHLDDFRLTRRIQRTGTDSYIWHLRIADLVAQLLSGIAGNQFSYDFLEQQGRGVRLDRAHVENWRRARGAGSELDYLLKNLEREGQNGKVEGNPATLNALGSRYPAELIKEFEQRQRNGPLDGEWFEALKGSKAPESDKARLFLAAAKKEDDWQQIFALRALADMKHPDAGKLILAVLARQPRTPKEPYWLSNIGSFAQIAALIDEDQIWNALLETGKRVDVGQRLQLLSRIVTGNSPALRDRKIKLFQAFLNDTEVRIQGSSELFNGPGAAFEHKRIAVRDYAALKLAYILNLTVDVEPTWKELQWKAFRERIEAELAKRIKR